MGKINAKEQQVFQELNKLADENNEVALPRWAAGFPNNVLISLEDKKCIVQVNKNNNWITYKVHWRLFNKLNQGNK